MRVLSEPITVMLLVIEVLDTLGALKVQGERLDLAYLYRWATASGVADLLERALAAIE